MKPICRACKKPKPLADFARNTNRGKRIVTICKLCVAEASKFSQRAKRLSAFVAELGEWPEAKLRSEAAWLDVKLTAIKGEMRSRGLRASKF